MKTVIFGYGAVGRALADRLARRDDAITVVQRTQPTSLPNGVRFSRGDASDIDTVMNACKGADAVVCAVGLPYASRVWALQWPKVISNLLDGASTSGARFLLADNLYMYGPQTAPLREDMTLTAYGHKPKVRAAITRLWQAAHHSGRVRAASVRASDFYGPGVTSSVISEYGIKRLLAGKPAMAVFGVDQPHDFTYVPDVARAIESLLDAPDDAYGQAWHVPNAPTQTTRAILTKAAEMIGVKPRISVLPAPIRAAMGLFMTPVRELGEMSFQWNRPYLVDASKFAAHFWNDPTPYETGLAETIAAYRLVPGV